MFPTSFLIPIHSTSPHFLMRHQALSGSIRYGSRMCT